MYNKRQQVLDGFRAESRFQNTFPESVASDRADDVNGVDFFLGDKTIDVKAIKSKDRGGSKDDSVHWLELKNVQGNPGWIYKGVDYIAFETNKYFILCNPKKLQTLIEELNLGEPEIKNGVTEMYTPYTRPGKQDVIVLISSLDLAYISDHIKRK